MLANAAWSVASGLCSVAVCTFGEATASGRVQPGRGWTTTAEALEFEEPFGLVGPVTSYALLTARHMADFGTTEEDLYAVAASARRHAARNPLAVRRTPFTFEEYRASRVIATPLRLYDCSSIVDGAGAVVVTTGARAADLPHDPVALLGVGSQMSHRDVGRFPDWDALEIGAATDRAFRAAGIGLADIDVAFITDGFTISTLVFLEEVGFCGRGEGGAYIRDGNLDLGSHCPVNTHGGLLSQGHVAGMLHVTEAIKQLRGKEGERQVDGAELALVTGGGAMFGLSAAMVLGRSDR
jgi:acetyl-CoA acetyltransferase